MGAVLGILDLGLEAVLEEIGCHSLGPQVLPIQGLHLHLEVENLDQEVEHQQEMVPCRDLDPGLILQEIPGPGLNLNPQELLLDQHLALEKGQDLGLVHPDILSLGLDRVVLLEILDLDHQKMFHQQNLFRLKTLQQNPDQFHLKMSHNRGIQGLNLDHLRYPHPDVLDRVL